MGRVDGLDLHGRVAFGAAQRERLEELVRYCARSPLAHHRPEKRAHGPYVLQRKTRWRDGTTHLMAALVVASFLTSGSAHADRATSRAWKVAFL